MEFLRRFAEGERFRPDQRQNAVAILRVLPLQFQQFMKIVVDGLPGGKIRLTSHDHPPHLNGGGKQLRRLALPLEDGDGALPGGAFALTIAPPGGLEDGVQPRLLPVNRREVHIHPRFDQGGGHHPAGKPVPQPLPDLLQLGLPVGGVHQGGQMEASVSLQPVEHLLGALPGVDHAKRLPVSVQPLCQRVPGQASCPLKPHPAKDVLIADLGGAQFHRRPAGQKRPEDGVQRRLGGGAQDGGNTIMLHQLRNGVDAGTQIGEGQHLSLVEYHRAARDVVELAALGRTAGVQGLEKLHRCGHHHRPVPVFRGLDQTDGLRIGFGLQIVLHVGVVLQHVFLP